MEFRALINDAGHPGAAMSRLVELARDAVPGCHWAAATAWPAGNRPQTRSYTGDVARGTDGLQYDVGEGPCSAASLGNGPIHVRDLVAENRWPSFRAAALLDGAVRGTMSYQLTGEPGRLTLTLYAARPDVFDHVAFTTGARFAEHTAALAQLVENAHDATTPYGDGRRGP